MRNKFSRPVRRDSRILCHLRSTPAAHNHKCLEVQGSVVFCCTLYVRRRVIEVPLVRQSVISRLDLHLLGCPKSEPIFLRAWRASRVDATATLLQQKRGVIVDCDD
jgi:hypothetical protein